MNTASRVWCRVRSSSAVQRGAGGGQHIAWLTGELLHQICYSRFYLSVVDLPPYLTF